MWAPKSWTSYWPARELLSEEDYWKLKAALDMLEYFPELVADKDTTIRHLRQLLLPASTEKTKDMLAKARRNGNAGHWESGPGRGAEGDQPAAGTRTQRRGWVHRSTPVHVAQGTVGLSVSSV
jgi:hypothetical protein